MIQQPLRFLLSLMVLPFLVPATGITAETLKMHPALTQPTGAFPQSVAIADLNNDGIPDLITADRAADTVTVHLGSATGKPSKGTSFSIEIEPLFVLPIDLNGNGNTDLVIANRSNSLSILPGNGDGSFQPALTTQIGDENKDFMPINIAAADFNNDGIPDLAVANFLDNSVAIFLGKGDFKFSEPVFIPVGKRPISLASHDFNNDGNADLTVTLRGENSVSILLGNGKGSFDKTQTIEIGEKPGLMAAGDLNNDGFPDLVIPNVDGYSLTLLLNDGKGSFTRRDIDAGIGSPSAVAIADLDGDGWLDIVAACQNLHGVTIFLNNGNAAFDSDLLAIGTNGSPDAVALGDLNGDGLPDIAAANISSQSIGIILSGGETAVAHQHEILNSSPEPEEFGEGTGTVIISFSVPEDVPAEFSQVNVLIAPHENNTIMLPNAASQKFSEKSFEAVFENIPLGVHSVFVFTGRDYNDTRNASRPGAFMSQTGIILRNDSELIREEVIFKYFDASAFKGNAEASGKLVDFAGNPVKDLELTAYIFDQSAGELELGTVRTDNNGNFTFKNLAAGKEYEISDSNRGIGTIIPGRENILKLRPQPGDRAPDIEFTHLESGEKQKLSDFRGKIVLIDFWAVWCGPCEEPMENLQRYRDENPHWGDNVELIAISIDDQQKAAERHLQAKGWTKSYNVWAGPGGFYSKPVETYGINSIPTYFLIDPEGLIVESGHPFGGRIPNKINDLMRSRGYAVSMGTGTITVEFKTPEGVRADFEEVHIRLQPFSANPEAKTREKSFTEKSFETTFENVPVGDYLITLFTGKNWADSNDASRPGAFRGHAFITLGGDGATSRESFTFKYFDPDSYKGDSEAAGLLLSYSGNPIAGGKLTAYISDLVAGDLKVETTKTDAAGKFRFKNLAAGKTYHLDLDSEFGSTPIGRITPGEENTFSLAPQSGDSAPDISFTHIDSGKEQKLSDFRGKIVLIDFWAVWCGPCQEPMENMQSYRNDNPHWGDKVELISISIDRRSQDAQRHLKEKGWTKSYNVWAGEGEFQSEAAQKYKITGIPTYYLIDADGKIISVGHPASDDLPNLINRHLQ